MKRDPLLKIDVGITELMERLRDFDAPQFPSVMSKQERTCVKQAMLKVLTNLALVRSEMLRDASLNSFDPHRRRTTLH